MTQNPQVRHKKNQRNNQQLQLNLTEMCATRQNENENNDKEKQNTRGATHLPRVWARRTRKEVQFNKFGQPVGINKGEFVEFLGPIVRNGSLIPLDKKDWHKVPHSLKRAAIDLIKEKFDLPPGFEVWTLKSLGKKWRSWKSRVKIKYFDENKSFEQNMRKRPDSDDERIFSDQWKNLVTMWSSMEARRKSVENKEHREQKKMNHYTGKRSFAEVSDDMKNTMIAEREREREICEEINDQQDGIMQDDLNDYDPTRVDLFTKCYTKNGSSSNSVVSQSLINMRELRNNLSQGSKDNGPNDTFSQVLKEKEGRVLMYGLGVSPSDIYGAIPSRATCQRMNLEYQNHIEKLIKRADDQDREINELKKMNMQRRSDVSPLQVSRVPSSSFEHFPSSNYQSTSIINKKTLKVWAMVKLKSMFDPSKIVAIGCIEGLEPSKLVGQRELGKNWCEVKINVALESDEELIRPFYEFTTIGEVVGKAIAWPIHLVRMEDDW